jgi:predicted dehydrogenase
MTRHHHPSRRQFLRQTAAASLGALLLPAVGRRGAAAANERLTVGVIGTGGRGRGLANAFMNMKDVQVVAVCDVDKGHREQGLETVNKKYGNKDCKVYHDFRELLGRKDIDAVIVATPDHWHALASVHAVRAGKDVYCEKPLTNSIGEGRALCDAVAQHKRILQTGSQERSGDNARFACELVRNGKIGRLHTVRINLPCDDNHHKQVRALRGVPPEQPVPEGFDYDFWLGHTPKVPYCKERCHFFWRFILTYGGGEMTDRGAHVIDLAQLGAGCDDTGPVEIEAKGVREKSLYDVFWDYSFVNTYANGVKMIGAAKGPRGVLFEGSEGRVFIHVHGQKLEAEPESLLKEKTDGLKVQLGRAPGEDRKNLLALHVRSFLEAVKSRKEPTAPAEVGHRTASVCHLNNIAMLVGRRLKWDPKKEQFDNDAEANRLLMPAMRPPWKL